MATLLGPSGTVTYDHGGPATPAAPAGKGSYVRRALQVTIGLGLGTDGEVGAAKHVLPPGLRIRAEITADTGNSMGSALVRIFGLTLDLMNQASTMGLGPPVSARNNTLTVAAGDVGAPFSQVFAGTLQDAFQDFGGSPETCLTCQGYAGLIEKLRPAPPSSYKGGVDVAVILKDLAQKTGRVFSNNGVSAILNNQYLEGTLLDQINLACTAGHVQSDLTNNQLAIWPMGQDRGGAVTLISPATGMQGYPMVGGSNYLRITTLFNPALVLGSRVQIESQLTRARGLWTIYLVTHALESETPGGAWFTSFECRPIGAPAAVA